MQAFMQSLQMHQGHARIPRLTGGRHLPALQAPGRRRLPRLGPVRTTRLGPLRAPPAVDHDGRQAVRVGHALRAHRRVGGNVDAMTDSHPGSGRRKPWIAGVTMAALAAVCAVISYNDGLLLIRLAGAHGQVAYGYPLLPDGLIVVSTTAAYEAARAAIPRPRWATAGIVLGAGLTVAMNVGAGAGQSWLFALADLFVPVVFFVALEILFWLIRRGGAGARTFPGPPSRSQCPHTVAMTAEDAVRLADEHARACLREPVSQRQLAASFGLSRARVAALVAPAPVSSPDLTAGAGVSAVNGDGPHA